MPELLTESFCERCGTRYTFEAAHQRVRLKGVKTLSRGLKNFVMSDDTSLDEAMAAARNETDREVTGHQLDAFHQTFNFCMSCRQYTCPNCWNEAEARCLSCAPHLGHEILPAPFPDMDPMTGLYPGAVEMEPEAIGAGTNGSNGHAAADLVGLAEVQGAQDAAEGGDQIAEIDAISRLASLAPGAAVAASSDVNEAVEDGVAAEDVAVEDVVVEAEPVALEAEAVTVEAEPVVAGSEPMADLDIEPVAAIAAVEPVAADTDTTADHNAAAAAAIAAAALVASDDEEAGDIHDKFAGQTGGLLGRFRPGRSMDAELAAYETEQAATVADSADAIDTESPPIAAEMPIVAEVAAPEPVTAEAAADETVSEAPEPIAAEAEDVFVQPTWQRIAPDPTPEAPVVPSASPAPSVPLASAAAQPEPVWPANPQWPSTATPTAGLPFLNRPAAPEGGLEALWALSNQEVQTRQAAAGKANGGIQPCVSCGLSLSANARFCRRCGTLQGG